MTLVITGETKDGKSAIVSEETPPVLVCSAYPFLKNVPLHAADAPIVLPTDGSRPAYGLFFPPPGGYRFFVLTIDPIDPGAPPSEPTTEQLVEANEIFPGLFSHYDEAGMERTDTVDLGYVISGAVVMHLDDGVERVLEAGDSFIQNGTRHRWSNPGSEPATFVAVVLGRDRAQAESGS